jgi:hypothetical protein
MNCEEIHSYRDHIELQRQVGNTKEYFFLLLKNYKFITSIINISKPWTMY